MVDINPTLEVHTAQDFADWLAANGSSATEIWPILYKKSSGKQTATFKQLLEVGLCYGWVEVMWKTLDDERYALRFLPRRNGSNMRERNRELARRLIAEGKMTDAGRAVLPPDLL